VIARIYKPRLGNRSGLSFCADRGMRRASPPAVGLRTWFDFGRKTVENPESGT